MCQKYLHVTPYYRSMWICPGTVAGIFVTFPIEFRTVHDFPLRLTSIGTVCCAQLTWQLNAKAKMASVHITSVPRALRKRDHHVIIAPFIIAPAEIGKWSGR